MANSNSYQTLLANIADAVQTSLSTLAGPVVDIATAVDAVASAVSPTVATINALTTALFNTPGIIAGNYRSLLTDVNSGISAVVAQLQNFADNSVDNVDSNLLVVSTNLVSNVVQLMQRVASSVASLLTGSVTFNDDIAEAAYGLFLAHIPAVNLVAQLIGQTAVIVASTFPDSALLLLALVIPLGNALTGFTNVIDIINTGITQSTNELSSVSTTLNGVVQTFSADVQPSIGITSAAITGNFGGILAAADANLNSFFNGVIALINSITVALKTAYPLVLGTISNLELTEKNIVHTLASLVAGTLGYSQGLIALRNLLNTLATDLTTLISVCLQTIAVYGDPVATVLSNALVQTLQIAYPIALAVLKISATGVYTNPGDVPGGVVTLINGTITILANSLQTRVTTINGMVSNIVDGAPTGVLAVEAGLASKVAVASVNSATYITSSISGVVGVAALDVGSLAANIYIGVNAVLINFSSVNIN